MPAFAGMTSGAYGGAMLNAMRAALRPQPRRLLVDEGDFAVDDGHLDRDVLDLLRLDRQRVLRQDGEIGELAGFDRALDALLEAVIGGVDGEHAQRLRGRDRLVGADGLAAPDLARYGGAHVAQRIGRPVAPAVRTRGQLDARGAHGLDAERGPEPLFAHAFQARFPS